MTSGPYASSTHPSLNYILKSRDFGSENEGTQRA
jgi:hypothetical protein